jgi:Transposase DDE domain
LYFCFAKPKIKTQTLSMVKILKLVTKSENESEKRIENFFSEDSLNEFARSYNYDKCGVKKISAFSFVHGFLNMFQEGNNSLRMLCLHIGVNAGTTIDPNSMESRFNRRTFAFVVGLLQALMQTKLLDLQKQTPSTAALNPNKIAVQGLLGRFNNVWLADSTCQKLPSNLSGVFESSSNQTGTVTATLRLQVIYNYKQNKFSYFDLGNYRENDQSSSDTIFSVAQQGDLVIRDLGYFALKYFSQMNDLGIFFISRYQPGVTVFEENTENRIVLSQLLKGNTNIDTVVELGVKERLKVRLVAQKLPPKVAEQRIAKAKKEEKPNKPHSKEYFELLKWEIFITNVSPQQLNVDDVCLFYQLRWFIEIIFKTWKSCFNFKKVLNVKGMSYYRAIITIVLLLIKITYSFTHLFIYIDQKVQAIYNKLISPMKFMLVINSIWSEIINIKYLDDLEPFIEQFAAHATYEVRKDRVNMRSKVR